MTTDKTPGAPVLPKRREQPKCFTAVGWAELRGYNNCFDEVAPLLAEIERYKTMSHNYCALGMDANTRIAELEALCGELYQVLGALDAPAQVLDKVSAASNGDAIPSGDLLPFVPEPSPKLVLPNKRTNFDYRQLGDEGYTAAQCWNDAIDEVTRLNRS